jgi:hypothetical protein
MQIGICVTSVSEILRSLCGVASGHIVRRLALGPDQELITETTDYADGQGFSLVSPVE